MNYFRVYVIILALLTASCATHTNISPVGQGNTAVNVNLGGPIVNAFNMNIPVPYLSADVKYGANNRTDLNAGLHIFPLFYGLAGLEIGGTYYTSLNKGIIPTLGIDLRLLTFFSLKSGVGDRFRLFPTVTPSLAWKLWGGMIYTGCGITMAFSRPDYVSTYPGVIVSPLAGYRWNLSDDYKLFTELKWNGVNFTTDKLAVTYVHPNNAGALGIYISLERSF